jgi:hypothetical protein
MKVTEALSVGGVPLPALAINSTGPVGLAGIVNVWENAPLASEVTVPSGVLLPPLNCCSARVMLVCAGRKLLPVTVACCPTLKVDEEIVSCGDFGERTV